jgi:DNA-binding CsgD family transcriptional regulator
MVYPLNFFLYYTSTRLTLFFFSLDSRIGLCHNLIEYIFYFVFCTFWSSIMTRLLYLPDDATLVQMDVEISARQLAAAINAGLCPIPALEPINIPICASQIGNTVIVSPKHKRGHPSRPLQQSNLTRRQQEVLELASNGYSNLEIAKQLGISRRTVSYHLKGIRAQVKSSPSQRAPE